MSDHSRIMLFDIAVGGHHSTYLEHLVRYWCEQKWSETLYVVVSPQFMTDNFDIVKIADAINIEANIKFVPITKEEEFSYKNQKNCYLKIFREWGIFCKYSKYLQINHALLMYFDHFQLPLFLGLNIPCSLSGIYFRPTFHYHTFENQISSFKDVWRQLRQKIILFHILKKSQLKFLFCLDPFVVKYVKQVERDCMKVLHLPDTIINYERDLYKSEIIKKQINIDKDRQVFLLFGELNNRKGVNHLLQSLWFLPTHICQKICILLVGKITAYEKLKIENHIQKISQSLPVQIIICNKFIPNREIHVYFEIANFVLVPYQRHVGMSSILIRAAEAEKPVLASNYGLIGEITRAYELGLAIDTTKPALIAQGITSLVLNPSDTFCNRKKMNLLRQKHRDSFFSKIIFDNIKTVIKY